MSAVDHKLTKILSRRGVCSRRKAEEYIIAGRVAVDGVVTKNPAIRIFESQAIAVDGKAVAESETTRMWLCYKPLQTIVSNHDPQGRTTLFDQLPKDLPRVMTVGRLDYMTEGLILLTNNGALARYLEHPSTGWLRRYRVRAYGDDAPDKLQQFTRGITIDGVTYRAQSVTLQRQDRRNSWYEVVLAEGKNREIRVVFEHCGLQVNRLIRTAYGPFELRGMSVGDVEEVAQKFLKEQLGNKGCDICGL